eukprot:480646_1
MILLECICTEYIYIYTISNGLVLQILLCDLIGECELFDLVVSSLRSLYWISSWSHIRCDIVELLRIDIGELIGMSVCCKWYNYNTNTFYIILDSFLIFIY